MRADSLNVRSPTALIALLPSLREKLNRSMSVIGWWSKRTFLLSGLGSRWSGIECSYIINNAYGVWLASWSRLQSIIL